MPQGVLIDEAVEMGFEFAGHFRRPAAAGSVHEALCACARKALHPFAQSGVSEMEGLGDSFDGLPRRHFTYGLSTAKDTRFLGLLHELV